MLHKRPGSNCWQIKFQLNGRTIRRSSQTSDKKLAERIEHQAREEILRGNIDGNKPPFSWNQAVDLWLEEKSDKRSLDTDIAIFKSITEEFNGLDVQQITGQVVAKYRTKVAKRATQATANRHLALLRALLRRLERLEIIVKSPHIEMYSIEINEPAWTTPEQIKAVLDALPYWAKDVAEFAVLTGLRRSNVFNMLWDWVDLDRKVVVVPAVSAKGKRTIVVPLSDQALAIIERRKGVDTEHVFTGPGRVFGADVGVPSVITTIKLQWAKAIKEAGVPSLRFHDLRHAWASYHTLNETPDRVLQALGGWSSPKMLERYAHLKPGTLEQYAGNVSLVSK